LAGAAWASVVDGCARRADIVLDDEPTSLVLNDLFRQSIAEKLFAIGRDAVQD
jgi:hypothetical protein